MARDFIRITPLPGRLPSPATPAELKGISQPSMRTFTPLAALILSSSPMQGWDPSRMKYMEG
ncbi:hypothetical protein ALP33_200065 [Pseudomonas amygdali pv. lachrymans]|uniref:Uncharacterized protein n=1 Tax=Pseudomonas amygdali pv. lachrymans TaxID=53707 RepID=A0AB37RAW7_PSEAV|nr:hypothetical protein ALP33_200065 [Pseudomonas amygdali pv. lachrymans]